MSAARKNDRRRERKKESGPTTILQGRFSPVLQRKVSVGAARELKRGVFLCVRGESDATQICQLLLARSSHGDRQPLVRACERP